LEPFYTHGVVQDSQRPFSWIMVPRGAWQLC
jgi:hypothetical protein